MTALDSISEEDVDVIDAQDLLHEIDAQDEAVEKACA